MYKGASYTLATMIPRLQVEGSTLAHIIQTGGELVLSGGKWAIKLGRTRPSEYLILGHSGYLHWTVYPAADVKRYVNCYEG